MIISPICMRNGQTLGSSRWLFIFIPSPQVYHHRYNHLLPPSKRASQSSTNESALKTALHSIRHVGKKKRCPKNPQTLFSNCLEVFESILFRLSRLLQAPLNSFPNVFSDMRGRPIWLLSPKHASLHQDRVPTATPGTDILIGTTDVRLRIVTHKIDSSECRCMFVS